eukprot:6536442-Pyramimonas_sp.AAC.1
MRRPIGRRRRTSPSAEEDRAEALATLVHGRKRPESVKMLPAPEVKGFTPPASVHGSEAGDEAPPEALD